MYLSLKMQIFQINMLFFINYVYTELQGAAGNKIFVVYVGIQ